MGSSSSCVEKKPLPVQNEAKEAEREEKEYFVINDPAIEVNPVLLASARLKLLSGNGDFYTGRFPEAFSNYRQCAGILMEVDLKEVDARSIGRFAHDIKELAHSTIILALNHYKIDITGDKGVYDLKSVVRMLERRARTSSSSSSGTNPASLKHSNSTGTLRSLPSKSVEDIAEFDLKLLADMRDVSCLVDTVGDCLNNFGCCKFISGDLRSAMRLYKDAMHLRLAVDGEECMAYAESLQNMATCSQGLEDWVGAETLLLLALSIEKKLGLEKQAESTSTLNNLGVLYSHMKRHVEAESLLSKVVEYRTVTLGATHRLTLNAIGNLIVVQKHMTRESKKGLAEGMSKIGGGEEEVRREGMRSGL